MDKRVMESNTTSCTLDLPLCHSDHSGGPEPGSTHAQASMSPFSGPTEEDLEVARLLSVEPREVVEPRAASPFSLTDCGEGRLENASPSPRLNKSTTSTSQPPPPPQNNRTHHHAFTIDTNTKHDLYHCHHHSITISQDAPIINRKQINTTSQLSPPDIDITAPHDHHQLITFL
ncbi:hypothetical protein E2C01_003574 [Portunus trituberculatus]|uniref:Uncharacterized protein n=1 Tax=Portunus trituberculatus TaxID=210409 RepID=A0A5B7CQ50_PORTR|nr:hypothetical protein [Portunus trituberculatus]